MAQQKPSIPKGTRDFNPNEMARRNYIFDTIRKHFKRYGFSAIETPAMENLSTLMGKYGEEGDKLLFKILNSGDFLSKVSEDQLNKRNSNKLTTKISEKGLRYDLTVPFARFVVQHRNELTFPFKRYQIQPVWRADRPQKGRYREFYQCDADMIGSTSLLNEVDLVSLIDDVFQDLKINVSIKLNNRKILSGIAEFVGEADKIIDITVAIDKLDKVGLEGVNKEMEVKGVSPKAIEQLQPIINLSGTNAEKLQKLKELLASSEIGVKGVEEMTTVLDYLEGLEVKNEVELDLTLARGLNYYTGTIFEVKALDVAIGSITGGGRYDDLTGIFGMPDVSGVGISFGADRIYDVLNELDLYPEHTEDSVQVFFVNFGSDEEKYCLPLVSKLRKNGINAELYPSSAKMKKQMKYANDKNVPFVVMIGGDEMEKNVLSVKNMETGEQCNMTMEELIKLASK
ncbi:MULTISPECIES: histidine--tRNA ligase [unclassified Lentimicrobium]|uniref:histidine--tRNA ligase n=1 Tax=unclassified Lentimicrobium TaxID=2677434 RepID=UPI0015581CA5|nr:MULTISPECIES: histidine--tRNA ligase [unclassified Lentimicrobium]NPD44096.1 histidine--tRNA ligase [Lentimicrobium sp. S6]NPD86235.1 histidine--tRNA ligase [Lentimicrobium sp. L6]